MSFVFTEKGVAAKRTTLKIMLYGGMGVGKTGIALSTDGAIVLEAEKDGVSRSKFTADRITVETWQDYIENLNEIWTNLRQSKYKYIVVDTIDSLLQKMLLHITDVMKIKDNRQVYGELSKIFNQFYQHLVTLNKTIVFIAHENRYMKDDLNCYEPDIPGKAALRTIQNNFDMIGYMYIDKDRQRKITFQIDHAITTKNIWDQHEITVPNLFEHSNKFDMFVDSVLEYLNTDTKEQIEYKRQQSVLNDLIEQLETNCDTPETCRSIANDINQMRKNDTINVDIEIQAKKRLLEIADSRGIAFHKDSVDMFFWKNLPGAKK